MKKCNFFVYPRQTGKTTKITENAIKQANSNKKVLIITFNNNMLLSIRQEIIKNVHHLDNKIKNNIDMLSARDAIKTLYNNQKDFDSYDKIFIDEYLYFKEEYQMELYNLLKVYAKNADIEIRTSPVKKIDKTFFKLVKCIKNDETHVSTDIFSDNAKSELEYLYYNFLTDKNTDLIVRYDDAKELYPPDRFDTEYLGKLFG
ncbi:MAG: hypothetical protein ACOCRK_09855 [bacterium]